MKNERPQNSTAKKNSSRPASEQMLVRYGGWALGLFMVFILTGIFFGQHFSGFLNSIGFGWLYHEESGVYADCSKASNRSNPYCIQKRQGDGGWRDLKNTKGDPSGFSLH